MGGWERDPCESPSRMQQAAEISEESMNPCRLRQPHEAIHANKFMSWIILTNMPKVFAISPLSGLLRDQLRNFCACFLGNYPIIDL